MDLDIGIKRCVNGIPKRMPADRVFAVRKKNEHFLGMGIAVLRQKIRRQGDGIKEWRQTAGSDRKMFDGARSATVFGTQYGGLRRAKRKDGEVFVRHSRGLGNQLQRLGNLLAETRSNGLAGIDQ